MVLQPMTVRLDAHNGVLLCFRGYVFQFMISNHCIAPAIRWSFLDDTNTLRILKTEVRRFKPICTLLERVMHLG